MTNDVIESFIADLRDEADTSHFSDLTASAIAAGARRSPLSRFRTRAATATASVLVAVGGLGGVAYAANGSAPGDLLYGIDRALETVGLGNGGAAERLQEVEALMARGRPDEGLRHATDLVEGDPGAQAALQEAAQRIAESEQARNGGEVAALLAYLSENIGSIDGTTVAEMARSIVPVGTPEDMRRGEGTEGMNRGGQSTPGTPNQNTNPAGTTPGMSPGQQNTPNQNTNPTGTSPGATPGGAAGGMGNGGSSGRMNP